MAFQSRRFGAVLVVSALAAMLAACNSTAPEAVVPAATGSVDRSPVYPDVTAPVTAATTQMSDEEAASLSARLTALAASRRSGAISEAEYRRRLAELQALAANHGQDTLAEIAGEN